MFLSRIIIIKNSSLSNVNKKNIYFVNKCRCKYLKKIDNNIDKRIKNLTNYLYLVLYY